MDIVLDKVEKRRARKIESVPSREKLVRFFLNVEQEHNSSYAVFPYINGLTELLKRLLKRHGIRTITKPIRTFEQHFPSPKPQRTNHFPKNRPMSYTRPIAQAAPVIAI